MSEIHIDILRTRAACGKAAAAYGAERIRAALKSQGQARIIVANPNPATRATVQLRVDWTAD